MNALRFSANSDSTAEFMPFLRRRIHQCLKSRFRYLPGESIVVARALFWAAASALCYGYLLTLDDPGWRHLPVAIIMGWCMLLVGFAIGHDASHGSVTHRPFWDKLIHVVSFVGIGIDPTLWRIRHIHSHHIFPNVTGEDTDAAENPLLRLSPGQRWRPHFRWQPLYAPLVYAIVIPHAVFIADWIRLRNELRHRAAAGWKSQARLVVAFVFARVLHWGLLLAVPLTRPNLDVQHVLVAYLVMMAGSSLLFSIMLVGTHFCEETEHPEPDRDRRLPHSWAVHNLVTACDWNPDSWLAGFVSGGANTHAAHHLFPNLPNHLYREITPIIRETAREFGLPYHALSLSGMIRSHFRFLKRMGQVPAVLQ